MSHVNNGSRDAPEYLQNPGDLSREDVDRIQKAEIERIIREPLEKVLGDTFFLHSSEEREVAFLALSKYVHPDKQPQDRKARATEAQQKLQEARDSSHIQFFEEPDVPTSDEAHNRLWQVWTAKAAGHGLKIDPQCAKCKFWLNKHNTEVETFNTANSLNLETGKFPLLYMQHQYKSALKMQDQYQAATNPEEKQLIDKTYKSLRSGLQEYCTERRFPTHWALGDDVGKKPEMTTPLEMLLTATSSETSTQSGAQQSQWASLPSNAQSGNQPQQSNGQPRPSGQSNGQPQDPVQPTQQSSGQFPHNSGQGQPQQPSQGSGHMPSQHPQPSQQNGQQGQPQSNGQFPQNSGQGQPQQPSQDSGQLQGQPQNNGQPQLNGQQTQLPQPYGQQGQPQSNGQSNQNYTLPNLNRGDESMHTSALTVRNEIILAKRKVYKTTQYLIQKSDGQKEWQTEDMCGPRHADHLELLVKKDRPFLKERKGKYKGLLWIALAFDGAILIGAGSYPPVAMMVTWLDNAPDCMLWRSDVIQVASADRIERDMEDFLPYSRLVQFEGRKIFIKSQTESGLAAGQHKAFSKIMKEDNKLVRSMGTPRPFAQQPAPPVFGQPSLLGPAQNGMQATNTSGSNNASGFASYGQNGSSRQLVPYGAQGASPVNSQTPNMNNSAMVPSGGTSNSAPNVELASTIASTIADSMQRIMQQQNLWMERMFQQFNQNNQQTPNQSQQQQEQPRLTNPGLTNHAHQQQTNQSNIQPNDQPSLPTGQQQLTNFQPPHNPTDWQLRQGSDISGQYPQLTIDNNPDAYQNGQRSQGPNLPSGPSANQQLIQTSGNQQQNAPVGQRQQQPAAATVTEDMDLSR